jgi:GT2 family glycosyltransferase
VRTTVAVVPREQFSHWPVTIDSIVTASPEAHLVLVDGGSPRSVRRRLEDLATKHDCTLVRTEAPLLPNEARNLALAEVDTELVVFVDNDVVVRRGWLDALERCARDTGAAAVTPIVMSDHGGRTHVHSAGGALHIEDGPDGPAYREELAFLGLGDDERGVIDRAPVTELELHVLLLRTDAVKARGGFDERLRGTREHTDLTLQLELAGHEMWREPDAVVEYRRTPMRRPADLSYFLWRWSEENVGRAEASFHEKWQLRPGASSGISARYHLNMRLRSTGGRPRNRARRSIWRLDRRARRALDKASAPLLTRRMEHRRRRAGPARVVRRGSWNTGAPTAVTDK